MAWHEGRCSRCGKTHFSHRQGDIVVCDCWQHCPVCGAEMTPYAPDLSPNIYGFDGRSDLAVLMVCTLHFPMFFSTENP